jgi:hypothetical protein
MKIFGDVGEDQLRSLAMASRGWVTRFCLAHLTALLAGSCARDAKDHPDAIGGASAGVAGETSAGAMMVLPGSLEPEGAQGGPWLGRTCSKDGDCGGSGLRCLSAGEGYMDGQGSPAHGLCTADCASDTDCRAFDDAGVCATLAEAPLVLVYASKPVPRLCMQGCSYGAPIGDTKCHGRPDLACRPFAPFPVALCTNEREICQEGTICYRGACREAGCGPRCNADTDCSGGRFCNPFNGLCEQEKAVTVPIGADCPGEGDPTSTICGSGICLEIGIQGMHVKRMCTQSCTIGGLCGVDGACVMGKLDDYAAGDAGYCAQRCNCDSECRNAADMCLPWKNAGLEAHFQSRGICNYAPDGTETLPSCGVDQGAGGSSAMTAGGAAGVESGGQGGRN